MTDQNHRLSTSLRLRYYNKALPDYVLNHARNYACVGALTIPIHFQL